MAFLELEHLHKHYATQTVVQDFNLNVEQGEFISFLGPSGCGKTTVLRMIAGFETPSAGQIRIDGHDVVRLKPNQRNIGMVFQSYALFPNLTVAQNIGFGLSVARQPKTQIKQTVQEMLALIKLADLGERYPFQLSGGQQQRVALARALAIQPKVLLLDEPLSALDAKIRVALREDIRAIQRSLGITTIFVTHDQEEALSISDRIVVMNQGHIEQVDTPLAIYNQPSTRFVASFVGALNILNATVSAPEQGMLQIENQTLQLQQPLPHPMGTTIQLALRPEALSLTPKENTDQTLVGQVQQVQFLGSVLRVQLKAGAQNLVLDQFNQPQLIPIQVGQTLKVYFASNQVLLLGAG
ncbi:ABC transporter ATP-binding protein [Thiofilum flexile]|uniref:ABC transporter ATP-binding protein n=1 Tax=Thiofilum flexile TaxID=125627 RepID=UPI00037F6AE6|nr:ABC transporter ATP-binding protein [Thiofilum flexile]